MNVKCKCKVIRQMGPYMKREYGTEMAMNILETADQIWEKLCREN